MKNSEPLFYPQADWIKAEIANPKRARTSLEVMQLLYKVALRAVELGYGPFAAALTSSSGEIIELNVNQVTVVHDCGAHAEAVVLQNAQRILRNCGELVPDLSDYTLYASGQPCVGCAGRIWLYRPGRVIYGVSKSDIERIANFAEGPISADFWERAKKERSIELIQELGDYSTGLKALELYALKVKEGTTLPYLSR